MKEYTKKLNTELCLIARYLSIYNGACFVSKDTLRQGSNEHLRLVAINKNLYSVLYFTLEEN